MNLKKILLLWVIFALLDPDPMTRLNLDPQPCLQDLHRELLRGGARPEPWYSREPRRLPLHTDKYYCKRGTVARSQRSVILS
jgi:hypothetical protein